MPELIQLHPADAIIRYPPEIRVKTYHILFSGAEIQDYPLQKGLWNISKMPLCFLRHV